MRDGESAPRVTQWGNPKLREPPAMLSLWRMHHDTDNLWNLIERNLSSKGTLYWQMCWVNSYCTFLLLNVKIYLLLRFTSVLRTDGSCGTRQVWQEVSYFAPNWESTESWLLQACSPNTPSVNIFLLSSLVKLAIRIIISQLFLKTGCSVAFRKGFKSGDGEDELMRIGACWTELSNSRKLQSAPPLQVPR